MNFDDFINGVMDLALKGGDMELYDEEYRDGEANLVFKEEVGVSDLPDMSEVKEDVDGRWQSWESEAFDYWMMRNGDAAEERWREENPGADDSDGMMIQDIYDEWREGDGNDEWSNFDDDIRVQLYTTINFKFYNDHWCSVEAEAHYEHRYSNDGFDSESKTADIDLDMVNGQNLKETVLRKLGDFIAGEIPENRTPVIPGLEGYFRNASSLKGPAGVAVRVAIEEFNKGK